MKTRPVLLLILGLLFCFAPIFYSGAAESGELDDLLWQEKIAAEKLFDNLLSAAAINEKVFLRFINDASLIFGKSDGGCYEEESVNGVTTRSPQTPSISLTYGTLWADKEKKDTPLTAYVLAHEISHLKRSLDLPKNLCSEEREKFRNTSKNEELAADQSAVRLLKKIGYDGVRVAEAGVRTSCERNAMLCPQGAATHPSLEERITAIKTAPYEKAEAEVEEILKKISFPVRQGHSLVGTGFNLLPSRNHQLTMAASAGHVWEYLYKLHTESTKNPSYEEKSCDEEGRCIQKRNPLAWLWDDLIAAGTKDPRDFLLFWKTSNGELKTAYAPVAEGRPRDGEVAYSLGMDRDGKRGLAILKYRKTPGDYLQFFYVRGFPMAAGTSGSPVLNGLGEIIGISVRSSIEGYGSVAATDVQLVAAIARSVKDHLPLAPSNGPRPKQNTRISGPEEKSWKNLVPEYEKTGRSVANGACDSGKTRIKLLAGRDHAKFISYDLGLITLETGEELRVLVVYDLSRDEVLEALFFEKQKNVALKELGLDAFLSILREKAPNFFNLQQTAAGFGPFTNDCAIKDISN